MLAKIKKTGEVVALKILKKEVIVAKVSKHIVIQQLMSKMEWWSLLIVSFTQAISCDFHCNLIWTLSNLNQNVIPQDEVAHTLTENRVLRTMVHPFLTVSCYMFHLYLIINFNKISTNQNYEVYNVCEYGITVCCFQQ